MGLLGCRGSRGRPKGSQRVKGGAFRVPGGQGVGFEGPKGSRGRPTGVKGWAYTGFQGVNSDQIFLADLRTNRLTEVFQEAFADLKSLEPVTHYFPG